MFATLKQYKDSSESIKFKQKHNLTASVIHLWTKLPEIPLEMSVCDASDTCDREDFEHGEVKPEPMETDNVKSEEMYRFMLSAGLLKGVASATPCPPKQHNEGGCSQEFIGHTCNSNNSINSNNSNNSNNNTILW